MIEWKEIELGNKKPNSKGELQTTCPSCSESRKKKKDPCLSVNVETGVAHCHHCGEKSIRDIKQRKVEYDLPPQQWENFTNLSDNVVKWFSNRGISQRTLIDCRITEEKFYQPRLKKEVNNIVFNYFYGVTLLNKKFRSSTKDFTQCKNAKKVFYGINDLEGEKECYIVEGEMDKLSLWEVGVKNCISVPNGANDLNDVFETCGEELKQIEKFYIAVDNDEAGSKLESALITRLGKVKCRKIEFLNGKDANDELQFSKLSLEDCLSNPIDYPIEGTFTAEDVRDEILNLYDNGEEETLKPEGEEWKTFNDLFSILMGQLTVVTGIPSSGKSNFVEWWIISLIKTNRNLKVSYFSPEHYPLERHHKVMAQKVVGKHFEENKYEGRMTRAELEKYIELSSDKIYMTMPENGKIPDWKWILQRWEEQCFKFGCNIFVVDAFNKVKMDSRETSKIGDVLADVTMFAQMHNAHVIIIAHPNKMAKNDDDKRTVPDLYDVKGSGDFYDQTHNGLVVHRLQDTDDKRDVLIKNLKAKFENQGAGRINESIIVKYNPKNKRYFTNYEDNLPVWDEPIQQEITYERKPIEEMDDKERRVNAMNRQSGYNVFDTGNENLLDNCPF